MATVTEHEPLTLSDREAAVATKFALDGLPIADVAAALGLQPGTAKSYLKRVRSKYRERGVNAGSQYRLRRALLADGYQETPLTPQ